MKKSIIAIALATLAASAVAGESYVGLGTTGVNLGYGLKLTNESGARIELNGLNYSRDFNSGDATYNAKIKLSGVAGYYDYRPFAGTFRLTGGLLVGDNKVTGTGTARNGNCFTINGTDYCAAGQSVAVTAKMPTLLPYLGIGAGHSQAASGFGFFADLGVTYGKPSTTLTASPGLAVPQANLDAERDKLQNDLNKLQWFPVIKLGVSYTY